MVVQVETGDKWCSSASGIGTGDVQHLSWQHGHWDRGPEFTLGGLVDGTKLSDVIKTTERRDHPAGHAQT